MADSTLIALLAIMFLLGLAAGIIATAAFKKGA